MKKSLQLQGHYEYDANPIGQGQYAVVHRGKSSPGYDDVAVKFNYLVKLKPKEMAYLNSEIQILVFLAKNPHPNIIFLKEFRRFENIPNPYIAFILEFCAGGTLKSFLAKQPEKRGRKFLKEDTARAFLIQLGSALHHLHKHNIVHRDLKPDNILLTESSPNAGLKLCDFGFSKVITSEDALNNSFLGSPVYMAPDMLKKMRHPQNPSTSKNDLWSTGCIFHEMVFGQLPVGNPKTFEDLMRKVVDNAEFVLPDDDVNHLSQDGRDLLGKLLMKSESQRISWRGFFEHTYLQPKSLTASTFNAEAKLKRSVHKQLARSRVGGSSGERPGNPIPQQLPPHHQQPVNTNVATTTNPHGNVPLGPPPKYTPPIENNGAQHQPAQPHANGAPLVNENQHRKPDRYPLDFSWIMKVFYFGVGTYQFVVKANQSVHSLKTVLEKSTGLAVSDQLLYMKDGALLEDAHPLSHYEIPDKTDKDCFLVSKAFLDPRNQPMVMKRLVTLKLSNTFMDLSEVRPNKDKHAAKSKVHWADDQVKQFYLMAVSNRNEADQLYSLFMERKYKPLKLCYDQIVIQQQSYLAIWKHFLTTLRLVQDRVRANTLASPAQKARVADIQNRLAQTLDTLRTIVVPQVLVPCFADWARPPLESGARARLLALPPPVSLSQVLAITFDHGREFALMQQQSQQLDEMRNGLDAVLEEMKGTEKLCDVFLTPISDKLRLFEPLFSEKKEIQQLYDKYSNLQRKLLEIGEMGFSHLTMQSLAGWDVFREYQSLASSSLAAFKSKVASPTVEAHVKRLREMKAGLEQEGLSHLLTSLGTLGPKLLKLREANQWRCFQYEGTCAKFQRQLARCSEFIEAPRAFPIWVEEIARRNEYVKVTSMVNMILEQEITKENRTRVEQRAKFDKLDTNTKAFLTDFFGGDPYGQPLESVVIKPFPGDELLPKFSHFDLPPSYALQKNHQAQTLPLAPDDEAKLKLSIERTANERRARENDLNEMERLADVARRNWEAERRREALRELHEEVERNKLESTVIENWRGEVAKGSQYIDAQKCQHLAEELNQVVGIVGEQDRLAVLSYILKNKNKCFDSKGKLLTEAVIAWYYDT